MIGKNTVGVKLGQWPGVVERYDRSSRECWVTVDGETDGGDSALKADIRYSLGDKSKDGEFSTEVLLLPGDFVWLEFMGADPRYPIVTGYRNAPTGNSVGWRRFHQDNIELLAKQVMNFMAGGVITIKSDVMVKIDAPLTYVVNDLTVGGMITGMGGMAVSGGDGASFSGNVAANDGEFTHNGTNVGSTHAHKENDAGGDTDGPH